MRRLLVLSVAAVLSACSAGGSTEPAVSVINVRVVDDTGTGVGRMPVTAVMSSGTIVKGVTRGDGTVRISVTESGVYRVSMVPREGYLRAADPLTRTISVDAAAAASIQFQVWRSGVSQAETPPETLWW